jgi:hypothetical protein
MTIPGTVQVTGDIAPTDVSDTYATHDSIYGRGGLREVADHTVRNAIPVDRRRAGMLVFTSSDAKYWRLLPGAPTFTDADWIEFSSGGTATLDEENKDSVTFDIGMLVTQHSSGSGVVRASAATNINHAIGMALELTAPTFSGKIEPGGMIELPDWTAITGTVALVRGYYFLSATSPGKMQTTPPTAVGQVVQSVGYALSPTQFQIQPQVPILL